ncbi:unnamed protein product [Jaminaea pallidilutea]
MMVAGVHTPESASPVSSASGDNSNEEMLTQGGSLLARAAAATGAEAAASNNANGRTSLDGYGIFCVIVFAVVMFFVIHAVSIPVPFAVSEWIIGKWRRICPPESDTTTPPAHEHLQTTDEALQDPEPPPDGPAPVTRVPSIISHHTEAAEATASKVATAQPKRERYYIVLNHVSTPIIGIIILLATTTIGGEQVKLGIVGDGQVEPYDTLLLFLSLAYIAISLDTSGLLRCLAFYVSIKGGRSGPRLFFFLYAFFFGLGLLVGNDAVVLSGTAFLVYFTRIAGLSRPDAWIWAQFAAANIASATLVSSNLTNVVVATGFQLKFTTYSAFMALPTVASGLGAIVMIRLLFVTRRERPNLLDEAVRKLRKREKGGSSSATPAKGANTSAAQRRPSVARRAESQADSTRSDVKIDGADSKRRGGDADHPDHDISESPTTTTSQSPHGSDTSGELPLHRLDSGTSHSKLLVFIPPHMIPPDVNPREALIDPFGAIWGSVVMIITLGVLVGTSVLGTVKVYQVSLPGAFLCFLRDLFKDLNDYRKRRSEAIASSSDAAPSDARNIHGEDVMELNRVTSKTNGSARGPSGQRQAGGLSTQPPRRNFVQKVMHFPKVISSVIPTVSHICARLPLPLLPFAFGMFILDESLAHVGFISIMAKGLGRVCNDGGLAGTAFFIGLLSVVLCCFGGTNIGSCILLVRSFQDVAFQSQLAPDQAYLITRVALYSLALGSNVGALGGTFAASLAGLLWYGSLKHGDIHVKPSQFFCWSLFTMPVSLSVGLVVVWAQVKSGIWPM